MDKPILLINQPCGIGDIFFCQKIAHYYDHLGYRVIWPLKENLMYLKDYLISKAEFVPESERANIKAYKVLDLQGAGAGGKPEEIMSYKYKVARVTEKGWQKYFEFKKPTGLAYPKDLKYNAICETFATPPETYKINIKINNGLSNAIISIKDTPFTQTPFDWIDVIENATELHLVDTVFTYFVEKLKVKARRMCLYPRKPFHDKIITKSNWTKPWEYIE
jgi:hypothetical protein